MKKLRVGIWLNEGIKPEHGGSFSYYDRLITKLSVYNFTNAEIKFLTTDKNIANVNSTKVYPINCKPTFGIRIILRLKTICESLNIGLNFFNFLFKKIMRFENNINNEIYKYADIIYYPFQGCEIPNFPYIYTHWDLGHISMFAFPEVSMNGVFEKRKINQELLTQKAFKIFTESNSGKEELKKYLQINEKRINVVPIFPSAIVEKHIASKKPKGFDNINFFIHYPAQFWAHKNHYNLLYAFKECLTTYPNLKLILTGSDKGNKAYVCDTILNLALSESILNLGFIETEELKWIYLNSHGLIMPTFLGPTNMPLLEAAELGCPVACSNLAGHYEQLGDYAHYFNPSNQTDICSKILAVILEKKQGINKTYINKFNINNTMSSMDEAFSEIGNYRFCWGNNHQIY